jgi:hypothetical protein
MWSMGCSRASFGAITLLNLSSVVVKSLAYNCCNSTVIVMYEGTTYLLSSSGRPFSEGVRRLESWPARSCSRVRTRLVIQLKRGWLAGSEADHSPVQK